MKRRVSGALTKRRLVTGTLSVAILLTSCSLPRTGTEPATGGYLVIGARPAHMFGLNDGDRLLEMAPTAVPKNLRLAVHKVAIDAAYDPDCTRVFAKGKRVVALLNKRCDGTVVEDGEALAGFTLNGDDAGGLIQSLRMGDYSALVPEERIVKKR